MLPKQARGTLSKHITKPLAQVAAPPSTKTQTFPSFPNLFFLHPLLVMFHICLQEDAHVWRGGPAHVLHPRGLGVRREQIRHRIRLRAHEAQERRLLEQGSSPQPRWHGKYRVGHQLSSKVLLKVVLAVLQSGGPML